MNTYLIWGSACGFSGFVAGGLLVLVYAAAATSRSQERMQRKVREARDEVRRQREMCGDAGCPRGQRSRWETW